MSTKNYLDYAGLKRVLKHLLPGARKIWHGNINEWNVLPAVEKDKYDQAEITIDAVDKIELGNKNHVMSKTVYNKHAEIGQLYQSTTFSTSVTGWSYFDYTFKDLPAGTYIMVGVIYTTGRQSGGNALGFMFCNKSYGFVGFQIPTEDWYAQTGTMDVIKHNGGDYAINIGLYKKRVPAVYGYIKLFKIA